MTPPWFPIAPLGSDLPNMIGSEGRALETFFPLCGTRWGFFLGCAYAPDSNRLIAPTSGIGSGPSNTNGHKVNIYEPQPDALLEGEPEGKGIRQPRSLAQTRPNGSPIYVESVDKFFFGISSLISGGGTEDKAFATVLPTSVVVDDVLINPAFELESIGGFATAGFVRGSRAIYITSKDRVWVILSNSTGQIAEIDPEDNTFTIITDAAISALTDFVYCPEDDCVYLNCFDDVMRIDVNTLVITSLTTLVSLTRVGSTATATTPQPHGLTTGDPVSIRHADQAEYNGDYLATVTGATTFDYAVIGTPVTPATPDPPATAISWRLPSSFRVHAMTWVPDNGVDPLSGRIWISIRDESGFQPCSIYFFTPTTNTYSIEVIGTASDFFSIMTFIPTIERIVCQKPTASFDVNFRSYQADLTLKLVLNRNLTGPGCYVDSLDKAALPVLKDGAWCIEFYTQAELSP